MSKIAIYTPYLDVFGGGERYMMSVAESLSADFVVDVLLDNALQKLDIKHVKKSFERIFNIDLSKVNFIRAPFGKGSSFFSRIFFLMKYDFLFYLTDGSIFYPTARRNILHIQSPIVGQPAFSWWGRFKLNAWNLIIYNSNFTKENSVKNWPLSFKIINPPVDIDKIKPLNKKKYILSVGRFFGYLKDKKQEILIKVFKDLYKGGKIKGWCLNLVGSAKEGDKSYINHLKHLAKGLPINFYPNLENSALLKLYGESRIYWHASGFGENDPTKMEHFGISTVEAMAGGCIPVVVAKGGQLEIVENEVSGFLWSSLDELKSYTLKIIEGKDFDRISRAAANKAKQFSKDNFTKRIKEITNE